jgi:hypothetical protein
MALGTKEKDPDAVLDYSIRWGAVDWVATTVYEKDAVVRNPGPIGDGCYYKALEAHTASAAFETDASSWELIEEGFWLDDIAGEKVVTSTWTVPTGITKDSDGIDASGKVTTIWLSGGTVGATYDLINHVITDNATAREDDRTFKVKVKEK